jgi:uncharacterized protein YdhG (YjbR/CyaY superfamily)
VEDYLASLDAVKARTLESILDVILGEFPELAAKIAWNIPAVHRDGKYVAGVAAFTNHLTYAPWSPRVIEAFEERLAGFVVKKGVFQLPVDWQIDRQLLTDLVRARLAELDAAQAADDRR